MPFPDDLSNEVASTATVDLSEFTTSGHDKGRGMFVIVLWWLVKLAFIQSTFPWPIWFKKYLLQAFGCKIGKGFYIRPGVNIHFPWKLTIGNNVWLGENTVILNLAEVSISDNVALAHEVYLAAAGHDIRDPRFSYQNRPIRIKSGAWVATRAYIGPGVTIGEGAVVAACACVTKDVPPWQVVAGVPARRIAVRTLGGGR